MHLVQVVIDYPTSAALSAFITKQLVASMPAATAATTPAIVPVRHHAMQQLPQQLRAGAAAQPGPLVVLATAARSPGVASAHDPSGVQDPVGLVPLDRWDVEADPTASTAAR